MPDYDTLPCPHCGNWISEDWFDIGECPVCYAPLTELALDEAKPTANQRKGTE